MPSCVEKTPDEESHCWDRKVKSACTFISTTPFVGINTTASLNSRMFSGSLAFERTMTVSSIIGAFLLFFFRCIASRHQNNMVPDHPVSNACFLFYSCHGIIHCNSPFGYFYLLVVVDFFRVIGERNAALCIYRCSL